MTIAAARVLDDGATCLVGIGLPSTAANLACRLHAPGLVLIYESGTIGARPDVLPLSIGDGILAETADTVVGIVETFNYWLQSGPDRHRLPRRRPARSLRQHQHDGDRRVVLVAARAPARRRRRPGDRGVVREVIIVCGRRASLRRARRLRHLLRIRGRRERPGAHGFRGSGPNAVITDLGVLEPDPDTRELVLTHLHPGVSVDDARAATGWDLVRLRRSLAPPSRRRSRAPNRARARADEGGERMTESADGMVPVVEARETDFVQSLQRGLAVIRAFDADHPALTLSDVARSTGLARAAARRFLLTLVDLGYIRVEAAASR